MSATSATDCVLSADAYRRIDREVAKYPTEQKQSAIMAALAIAQAELGWLPKQAIELVARYLQMPSIAAYEVATFYAMYDLGPPVKHKITLCTNLPCSLSGANRAAQHLKDRLGITFGEKTDDGRFALQEGECQGACGDAPVLLVNNLRMCSFMTNDRLDELLAGLKA